MPVIRITAGMTWSGMAKTWSPKHRPDCAERIFPAGAPLVNSGRRKRIRKTADEAGQRTLPENSENRFRIYAPGRSEETGKRGKPEMTRTSSIVSGHQYPPITNNNKSTDISRADEKAPALCSFPPCSGKRNRKTEGGESRRGRENPVLEKSADPLKKITVSDKKLPEKLRIKRLH